MFVIMVPKTHEPGRWARVLELKSSLRMAIQIWVQNRLVMGFALAPIFPRRTEQSGERVLLISFS